jgi:hypothetical protein
MIFKLAEAAEKSWRHLNGHNQLPKIILGIKSSPTESRFSDRKLKPLPPDPFRRQDPSIAHLEVGPMSDSDKEQLVDDMLADMCGLIGKR